MSRAKATKDAKCGWNAESQFIQRNSLRPSPPSRDTYTHGGLPANNPSRTTSRVKKPNTPESPVLSVAQRRYFYFTAAVTGGAIMIVEILGAKMLSPYIGTSHFVWTAQIAVTLIALALGYYVGGWLVDRSQPRDASP